MRCSAATALGPALPPLSALSVRLARSAVKSGGSVYLSRLSGRGPAGAGSGRRGASLIPALGWHGREATKEEDSKGQVGHSSE